MSNVDKSKMFASIMQRFYILILMWMFLWFSGMLIVENHELLKVIPATSARALVMIFGYFLAIASSNYFLAIRAENFTIWKVELSMSFGLGLAIAGVLGPSLFPSIVTTEVSSWGFWTIENESPRPNNLFYVLLLPSLLLVVYSLLSAFRLSKG